MAMFTMDPEAKWGNTSGTYSMISKAATTLNVNCARTFATLRLYGDGLRPAEISEQLRLQPTDTATRGERSRAPSGKERVAPIGRWILETEGVIDSTDLGLHISWILDQLDVSGVVPTQLPDVSRADVCCFWVSSTGHGGPVISPEVLGRLARYNLTLDFDIYFDDN